MQEKKFGFTYADQTVVEERREKLARLYTFLKRYLMKTVSEAKHSYFALGVFSKDGILLDVFAKSDALLKTLQDGGLWIGSVWNGIGYNAISKGGEDHSLFSSIGEENECEALKNWALYYAPINILSPYEPYDPMEQCGLGLMVPLDKAWDEYETMVSGIAFDMMITMQFNNIATMYYERSGKGLLSIDTMMSPEGDYLATYYNDELFRILGVKPVEMYYRPVTDLIDPLPANRELWEIVETHKVLMDHPLTIRVRGKEVSCIVSTDVYNQPAVNAHGVIFYLTTHRKMVEKLSEQVANSAVKTFDDIVGQDEGLVSLIERAKRMAATESNIMILGESGTGKDIFAQAIHNASRRRNKPFIALNCGAIPRDLIESELFGYESGAFTGGRKNGNMGKFELAMGGTVFLDEIGEMPLDLQAKLLRVVEQKQIMRLGGTKTIHVDVKIIAATNVNIWEMIEQKKFRADLFYRLSTMRLNLMPLRERKGDIVPLAEYFIRHITEKIGKPNVMRLAPQTKKLITDMKWYGNIRELQNLIECIVQLYPGDMILPEYILENVTGFQEEIGPEEEKDEEDQEQIRESEPEPDMEKIQPEPEKAAVPEKRIPTKPSALKEEEIRNALEVCGNNRSEAAKYLGISRRSFYRKLEQLGIE